MLQKVLRVGTSAAVTIPKKSLEEMGIKIGDNVQVSVDAKSKRFTIEAHSPVNEELFLWTKKFIDRYRDALLELADK
ncbi:MAG: hypothetical protein Q7R65_01610 [bacterium]|nr:hypothetical protein [bacterium]